MLTHDPSRQAASAKTHSRARAANAVEFCNRIQGKSGHAAKIVGGPRNDPAIYGGTVMLGNQAGNNAFWNGSQYVGPCPLFGVKGLRMLTLSSSGPDRCGPHVCSALGQPVYSGRHAR